MYKSEKYVRKHLKATERAQADSISNARQLSRRRVSWHVCRMWPAHSVSSCCLSHFRPQADVTLKSGCEPTSPSAWCFHGRGKTTSPFPRQKLKSYTECLCFSLPPPQPLVFGNSGTALSAEDCLVLWKLQINASAQNTFCWPGRVLPGEMSGGWVTAQNPLPWNSSHPFSTGFKAGGIYYF